MNIHKVVNNKMRKFIIVSIGLSFGLVVLLAFTFQFWHNPKPRVVYREYDFENDPWLFRFNTEYKKALDENSPWIKDAKSVALYIAGYPNDDGIMPDQIQEFPGNSDQVIIVVLWEKLMGDSAASEEIRVDLIRQGDIWKVEWAGGRYKCQPGRGHLNWGPSLCK